MLLTTVTLSNGDAFQITDFCPRFEQYGRIYRPSALFRLVEPLQATPAIRVSCRPVSGWDKVPAQPVGAVTTCAMRFAANCSAS